MNHIKQMTMNPRIDYTQIAAKLNYAALDKKLEQLRDTPPPKKRKQVSDLLAPVGGAKTGQVVHLSQSLETARLAEPDDERRKRVRPELL